MTLWYPPICYGIKGSFSSMSPSPLLGLLLNVSFWTLLPPISLLKFFCEALMHVDTRPWSDLRLPKWIGLWSLVSIPS